MLDSKRLASSRSLTVTVKRANIDIISHSSRASFVKQTHQIPILLQVSAHARLAITLNGLSFLIVNYLYLCDVCVAGGRNAGEKKENGKLFDVLNS